jgi:hypothetical protein
MLRPGNRHFDFIGFCYFFNHLNGDIFQALLHAATDGGCPSAAGSTGI